MPRTNKGRKRAPKKIIRIKGKKCLFTEQKIEYIDYKDIEVLKKFTSNYSGKILPRRMTGTSMKHQRKLANAIKVSREMGLMPFIPQ